MKPILTIEQQIEKAKKALQRAFKKYGSLSKEFAIARDKHNALCGIETYKDKHG